MTFNDKWMQALAICAALFATYPMHAVANERAGEAEATDPNAFQQTGILPEFVNVGSAIIRNARVYTQESGSLKLLFDDGTRLSMGSNSEVVIDDYVYDPDGGTSRAIFELGRGVMRVVSGRIPSERVGVVTPVATVGIRGTQFLMDTSTAGNLRVWVESGTVVISPDQGQETYELSAPAFASCGSSSCTVGDAPVAPTTEANAPDTSLPGDSQNDNDLSEDDDDDD